MDMNQVIFFTPHFLPRLGGVETHVAQIARVLSNRQWKVTVVTFQDDEKQHLREKIDSYLVIRIPLAEQKTKTSVWNWVKKYFETVSAETIIHIHDVGWWCIWQLAFNKKNKFYITFHGWEGVFPIRWQAKLHRLCISWLVKGSIHVGKFIQLNYWDKPSAVVYGGVGLPVKSVISEPSLSSLKLVFLGRLEKENEIELYIEVLSELAAMGIKSEVTWVGDGTYRTICEKWGKVTGMVIDTRKFVSEADFVFASSYLSILESQAQGKIVCSLFQNKLKKEYLQTYPANELLVLSDNPQKVAEKMRELSGDYLLYRQLSKKSAVFAQSQTWNSVADVYEKLWGVK